MIKLKNVSRLYPARAEHNGGVIRALDEPVESLSRVRNLLRDGHHAFPRTEPGVGLIEDPG